MSSGNFQLIDINMADGFMVETNGFIDFDCKSHYTLDVTDGSNWTTRVNGNTLLDTEGTTQIFSLGKLEIKTDASGSADVEIEGETFTLTARRDVYEVVHKNTDSRVMGNDFSFRFGATESIMIGNAFGLFIGTKEEINISASLSLKLAAETAIGLAAKMDLAFGTALQLNMGPRTDLRIGTTMAVKQGLDINIDAGASKVDLIMGVKMTAEQTELVAKQTGISLATVQAYL